MFGILFEVLSLQRNSVTSLVWEWGRRGPQIVNKNDVNKLKEVLQRTPWGGGKKRGEENLTNDTPPKKGFWTPPSYGTFSTPLKCRCCVFPVQNPRQSGPDALLEGSKNFQESAFSGTFSSPDTFCTPHITAQVVGMETSEKRRIFRWGLRPNLLSLSQEAITSLP